MQIAKQNNIARGHSEPAPEKPEQSVKHGFHHKDAHVENIPHDQDIVSSGGATLFPRKRLIYDRFSRQLRPTP